MTTSSSSSASAGSRLRPYLTTAQLISLAALASPIISLLFILFRLRASSDVAQQSVTQAKTTLQASCIAAEHAASVGASLPRYFAIGVNDQITDSVRATMEGVRIGLTLSLTATEAIIEFIIDMYRSTFLCLLELVIRGGLAVVIAAVSSVTSFVNNTLSTISSGIAGDIASANSVIQTAVDAIKKIPLVGSSININVPQFSVPSASQLSNIQIPTTFEDSLRTLNSSIPTLEDLREKLDNLISIPFQLVKKEINDTFIAAQGNFTLTPLPIPQQATITFCGDTLNNSFDNLARDLLKVAEIGFFIVIGTMVLLFLGYAFITWYSQRSMRNNIERIRLLWFGEGTATTDRLLAFDALISHPTWSRIVQFLSEKFRLSQEKYDALTWFGLYVFHPAPMACLLIGIFGILSVQLQLLIIHPLQAQYSHEIANNVNDLTTTIATKLNDTMWQDSAAYAQSLNDKIGAVQSSINNDLFGWVNATIVPLNNTIATFYEEVQDTVNAVLGGTPFDAPAQEFIRCIIGSKVVGIEHALTFLQQNLQVNLPQVNTSVLVLSQSNVNEVATPISAAAVGSSDDGSDGGVVGKIITAYINSLEKERITFFIFLGLWGLVVVMALFIIMWHFWFAPGLRKAGWKTAGSGWDNGVVPKSDQDQEKYQMRNLRTSDVGPVSPIPSPLRKNTLVASTGATVVMLDEKNMRQRRGGDDESTRAPSSFLPENEPQRPGLFARIGGLVSRRGKHTPKRDSGSSIIPIANAAQPPAMEEQHDWLGKVAFWKRNADDTLPNRDIPRDYQDNGFEYDHHRPRFVAPAPRRGSNEKIKPILTVDVAKAATMTSSQPRVIVENPDYVSQTSSRPMPSRKTTADSDRSGRDYLAVPSRSQAKRVAEPKPPAWVIAMKNKQNLPAVPGESASRSSPPARSRDALPSSSNRAPDTRSPPRRPPGLPTEDRGRRPSASKGSSNANPRDRQRREERRHARRSSVPPGAGRDRESGQRRNKSLTRSSSVDDVDPFATPISMNKPLPLPLEPVKLHAPIFIPAPAPAPAAIPRITVTNPAGSSNPFVTPFDDIYAVHPTGQGHDYNFSMPSRRPPGAI